MNIQTKYYLLIVITNKILNTEMMGQRLFAYKVHQGKVSQGWNKQKFYNAILVFPRNVLSEAALTTATSFNHISGKTL